MANEDQHERQNDDPTVYINKVRIHRDAEAKRNSLQSNPTSDQPLHSDKHLSEEKERKRKAQLVEFDRRARALDAEFRSSPQGQAQQAERDAQMLRAKAERDAQVQQARAKTKAEADAILRRHAEWDRARRGSNQQQPSATGSSGTGCVISVAGFIVLVACFFALAELRLLLVPALRAGILFFHIVLLLLSGGN